MSGVILLRRKRADRAKAALPSAFDHVRRFKSMKLT
jgi:hypothetical protein